MTIMSFSREATKSEMAAEIDRRGAVIERLEATIEQMNERNGTLNHACTIAHIFVVEEREVRELSGPSGIDDEPDFLGEAREVERILAEALLIGTNGQTPR